MFLFERIGTKLPLFCDLHKVLPVDFNFLIDVKFLVQFSQVLRYIYIYALTALISVMYISSLVFSTFNFLQ